jgi:broad specificity phosphatase PhoE
VTGDGGETDRVARLPPPIDALHLAFLTGVTDATEIVLIRHGQQALPPPGEPVGALRDPPLSDAGRRQAVALAERFAGERVDAVYSSDLRRAADTGRAVAERHGHDPVLRAELREIGVFRDLPADRPLAETLGEEVLRRARQRMLTELRWDAYPASETSAEFRARISTAVERIIADHPGGRVVVACHGGAINAYVAQTVGADRDMLFRVAHTGVTVLLAHDRRRVLVTANDVGHLVGTDPALLTY